MPQDSSFDWSSVKPIAKEPVSPPQSRPLIDVTEKEKDGLTIAFLLLVLVPLCMLTFSLVWSLLRYAFPW